jgi:hypothetical protein
MSGPVVHVGKASMPAVGDGLPDTGGWEQFKKLMDPAVMPDPYRPEDAMMMEMARYATSKEGAAFFKWLRSISNGAPYPQVSNTFEGIALASAKHQGRCIVGELVSNALAEGERLRALKG